MDADEDILQMLATGARVIRNEAESLGDQDDSIELNQWGNPIHGCGNRSTSTSSSEKTTVRYNGFLERTFGGTCTKREATTIASYGDGNSQRRLDTRGIGNEDGMSFGVIGTVATHLFPKYQNETMQ
jgi:hypothetical protein